ncbi:MAG TPA: helix-turn-helix transcriptional regulator [Chthonomonadaceae bacterium]|nr:helix-turn-helix transcriptional regulator [Chthonomonadaceae bacterium]
MDDERELLKGNTPTLVLAILNEGPQHTYAIGRAIAERAGEALKFKRGTLYPVLHALEKDGLVVGEWEHLEGERPRRIYTITEAGRAELARRVEVWDKFAQAMNALIAQAPRLGDLPREQPA